METQRFRTHGLLGTDVDVAVVYGEPRTAETINELTVAHLGQLERELSIYDESSSMSQWAAGHADNPGEATVQVIRLALRWRERSGGAFDPFVAELADLWSSNAEPAQQAVDAAIVQLRATRVVVEDNTVRRLGDCSRFNANAVAKGWIVDQVMDLIQLEFPKARVCIAVGGDLAWSGPGTWQVGIENPLRPYDNEPPLQTIQLPAGAIATSGSARRKLGSTRLSHLIDPRSGRPATAIASVSVIAARAADADAAATAAAVMDVDEALDWLARDSLIHSALVIAADGTSSATQRWPS